MKTKTIASKKRKQRISIDQGWETVHPHAAGIDIGCREHFVCVPLGSAPKTVRSFGTCTEDLEALSDWLQQCGVDTVAMEATGVYWIPVFQILERRGLQVLLVNARQTKHVAGRKSDVQDCQWIQRLHTYGLLQGSFRPADPYCVVRTYLRYRDELVSARSTQCQHMQKALQQMNIQLTQVLSDVAGRSGLAIIEACDQQIVRAVSQLTDQVDLSQRPLPERKAGRRLSQDQMAGQDLRTELYRKTGVDLTAIEGIGVLTSLVVFSEVGPDLSRFPTEKHFCSWLGLCPDNRISGGKVLSSRTRRVNNRVADALRLAATTLERSPTALGGFHRRMKARLGAAEAVTATAHKLARIIYRLVKHGEAYVRQGMEDYERKFQDRKLAALTKTAKLMEFELIQKQSVASGVS